jgi:hypothetical protein
MPPRTTATILQQMSSPERRASTSQTQHASPPPSAMEAGATARSPTTSRWFLPPAHAVRCHPHHGSYSADMQRAHQSHPHRQTLGDDTTPPLLPSGVLLLRRPPDLRGTDHRGANLPLAATGRHLQRGAIGSRRRGEGGGRGPATSPCTTRCQSTMNRIRLPRDTTTM